MCHRRCARKPARNEPSWGVASIQPKFFGSRNLRHFRRPARRARDARDVPECAIHPRVRTASAEQTHRVTPRVCISFPHRYDAGLSAIWPNPGRRSFVDID
jgi:hypothetical protein